jgi:hypothetical protein
LNGDRKPSELFRGKYSVRAGRFSPDGRFLAFSANASGRFESYVGSLERPAAKPVRISTDGALGAIFWRQDGKELHYMTLPGFGIMAVDLATAPEFHAGTPQLLFRVAVARPGQLSCVGSP